MAAEHEQDKWLERLLGRTHAGSLATPSDICLDAETLAAWADGSLHAKELAALAAGQRPETTELEVHDQILDAVGRQQLTARLADIAAERDRACAIEDFTRAAELMEPQGPERPVRADYPTRP